MSTLRALASRLAGFLTGRGRRADPDLDDEIRFHLEMLEQQHRRRGLDAASARRAARAEFGGVTQIDEAYRDQRSLPGLETFIQDVRYGARMLRRAPGFTAAALVTLALGIGANTAMFSTVYAVILQPLPYAAPERLVAFGDRAKDGLPSNIDYATWQDYRDRIRTFESVAAIRSWQPTLVAGGEAEGIPAMRVSANYFSMLGIRPALGRDFKAEEDRPEQWRVLLISDGLWRRRFGADPSVVGRTIRMNDRDYQIVGVLPADFEPLISEHFYKRAEMWAPLGYDTTLNYACRGCQHLRALGRIAPGTTLEAASSELNAIRSQLAAAFPAEYPRGDVAVMRLQDKLTGPVRGALFTLLAAVAFVLLIACANVANLLLARGMQRSREMAVRAALGAGRGRIMRQLLTESLLLSLAGGALGVGLAALFLSRFADLAPVSIPRLDQVALDARVLAFALIVSVVTGAAFGLAPARRGARPDLQSTLATDSRSSVGGGSSRARRLLVVGDLALALVLLAGAGLMLKSVARLVRVDPGFTPSGVLTLQYSLSGSAYAEDASVVAFNDRFVERVRSLPGVDSAAVAGQIPMGGNGDTLGFHIEGRVVANPAENPSVERYSVTPEYFRVMGIPLRRGRLITAADSTGSLPVMVISESTAKALWPGAEPIGRRVRTGGPDSGPWRTIVGIAGDVRHTGLDTPATLQMYLPQAQLADSFLVLVVRAAGIVPASLTTSIRAALKEMDPTVPVYDVAPLEDLVGRSIAQRRFVMQLLSGFAALALLLAAVGLYGVVSYTIAQRTREVGVRMALGATRGDILRLVFSSGFVTVAAGLGVGLAVALIVVRFMDTLLYDVSSTDPATLAGAAAALAAVALLAHWIPAQRALRVDPAIALRQE